MTNNYVFNRLLTTLNLHRDHDMIVEIFKLGGNRSNIAKSTVKSWRTSEPSVHQYMPMPDGALVAFFDGLQEASKQNLININAVD